MGKRKTPRGIAIAHRIAGSRTMLWWVAVLKWMVSIINRKALGSVHGLLQKTGLRSKPPPIRTTRKRTRTLLSDHPSVRVHYQWHGLDWRMTIQPNMPHDESLDGEPWDPKSWWNGENKPMRVLCTCNHRHRYAFLGILRKHDKQQATIQCLITNQFIWWLRGNFSRWNSSFSPTILYSRLLESSANEALHVTY